MSIRMSATIFSSRDLAGQHLLHRAPALLELRLGQVVQPLGLGLEPLVDLRLRGDVLVDVPRLVAQVEHHAVPHRLVELVGVDVAAEDLDALLLVGLQQRRAGEADEHRIRAGCAFIALCSSPDWVRWHSSTKTIEVALGLEVRRQRFLQLLDVSLRCRRPPRRLPCRRTCGSASTSATALVAFSVAIRSAPLLVR